MIKAFFADYRIKAVFLFLVGLVFSVSLLTYTPSDPSMNLASNNIPGNFLSIPGAYLADFLYQSVGLASFLFPACLISWAVLLIRRRQISYLLLRSILMILAIIPASMALSKWGLNYLPSDGGGAFGKIFLQEFIMLNLPYSSVELIILASIGVAIILTFFALAIPFSIYADTFMNSWNIISYPFKRLTIFDKIKARLKKFDPGEAFYAEEGFQGPEPQYNNTPPLEAYDDIPPPMPEFLTQERSVQKPSRPSRAPRPVRPVSLGGAEDSLPSLDLLDEVNKEKIHRMTKLELEQNAEMLMKVLNDFGVKGQVIDVKQGPVVTLYEFEPAAGTKSSRVIGLSDDIARSLSAVSTRIAVIPGRNALGIELPNKERMFFCLRELIETDEFQGHKQLLPLILGKDLGGTPYIADLAKMPHLLVAGTTGSGKSVAINAMIMSLLYRYRPDECKMIMIDPKMLELSAYDDIPHLLTPVVTEPGKAVVALKWAVKEMENRYRLMSHLGVRNIANYNSKIQEANKNGEVLERTVQTGFDPETGKPIHETVPLEMENMPFIVVIVDEMADLMLVAGKDIESSIQRLAQMARAAGIHIIMATQRPSVDVITGVIKANFPSRISFRVTSKIDARTILGEQGSEQLLGMGDMLFMGNSSKILRVHGPFVDDKEVERVTKFLRSTGAPAYISAVTEDPAEMDGVAGGDESGSENDLYQQAVNIVKTQRKSSISYIQRSLRIGYNKAANLVEEMERKGVLTPANHSGKREILLPEE